MTENLPAAEKKSFLGKPRAALQGVYLLKKKTDRTASDKLKFLLTTTISIIFWFYVSVKLFIFDIDNWVFEKIPHASWLLSYKLIAFLCVLAILWAWLKSVDFISFILYILIYPLKILFFKIPILVGILLLKSRSWVLALALGNSIVSIFRNLKFNFVITTCFIVFALIAIKSQNSVSLYFSASALAILLIISYIRSFFHSISNNNVYQIYASIFRRQGTPHYATFALDEDIRACSVEQLQPDQLVKWNSGLERSVVYNRLCLFFAKRLRDYQRSPWPFLPVIFSIMKLVFYTVFSFMLINIALWKSDHGLYSYTKIPSLFTFGYFSFNALLLNAIDDLKATQTLSQSAFMAQECLSFLLVAILISMVFTQRAQRASSDLDEAIANAEREAASVETWIKSEFQIASIQTAMEHLQNAEVNLTKFIFWLSKGI